MGHRLQIVERCDSQFSVARWAFAWYVPDSVTCTWFVPGTLRAFFVECVRREDQKQTGADITTQGERAYDVQAFWSKMPLPLKEHQGGGGGGRGCD